MKSKQTAFLLVFLFVLMASASAQPRDVEMTEELVVPKVTTVFLSDFHPDGRTITKVATSLVEEVPLVDSDVDDNFKKEIKVLDKYELLKDDYFTRRPIILLQNSRAKTDN